MPTSSSVKMLHFYPQGIYYKNIVKTCCTDSLLSQCFCPNKQKCLTIENALAYYKICPISVNYESVIFYSEEPRSSCNSFMTICRKTKSRVLAQCYKTFYIRFLPSFLISSSVCALEAFPGLNNICRWGLSLPKSSTF